MAKRLITIVTTSLALLASTAALAGTAYTKIANNGAELDDTVTALGSGPLDWACTRDNATGLVWEVSRRRFPVAVQRPTLHRLAPFWRSWRGGIGQALRAGRLVSGLRPVMLFVPRPTSAGAPSSGCG